MMSCGSQVPGWWITAVTDADSGGRGGRFGRSVGDSPAVGSPTQISTPSSYARYGLQVRSPSGVNASPCQRQYIVPPSTGQLSSNAPRCGHAPGPATRLPSDVRQKATSRPAMVRAIDTSRPTSELTPATNQPPESCACDSASAAAIRAGRASRQVDVIRSSRGCGTRAIGIRARTCSDNVAGGPSGASRQGDRPG